MSDSPDLRREFVGIMFALAVGEVGLQTAGLVQAGNRDGNHIQYLPAYSHLFLALFVIAASWVGWSRTQVPGAKKDVNELFEWPFVVLLLDTAMVVTYFILVRTVNFSDDNRRIDPAKEVALWHVVIFGLYVVWDVVTKIVMYERPQQVSWIRGLFTDKDSQHRLLRILPTVICFVVSLWLWRAFEGASAEHLISADFALLSMVLLFRALKSLVPAIWQSEADRRAAKPAYLAFRSVWSGVLVMGLLLGSLTTIYGWRLPLPASVIIQIRTATSTGAGSAQAEPEPSVAAPGVSEPARPAAAPPAALRTR